MKILTEYHANYSLEKAVEFNLHFNHIIKRIEDSPKQFPVFDTDFRKALLGKPSRYKVIFRIFDNDIYIIALVHDKRHPEYWKKRLEIRS
ncbi:MAG: hypothetical protein AAGG68_17610 [Bacteroidota bacterium]